MTKLIQKIKSFAVADAGAALVEYGLILGVIIAVSAGALTSIGTAADEDITAACTAVGGANC